MKKQIKSAELERYNANSRGSHSPDCVKRSISLAFDIPYNDISKMLNERMKETRAYAWNIPSVFSPLIKSLGGSNKIIEDREITVNDFADENPKGTFIISCGKKHGSPSHLVTIRDGVVWDSWDSRKYYVCYYWKVNSANQKPIRDNKDQYYMLNLADNYAKPAVHKEMLRYMNKKDMNYKYVTSVATASKYQMVIKCSIKLEKDEIISKDRTYDFKIILVIEPTLTEPEIIEFVEKTGKQKTYDRMWAINEQEKKLKEAAETEKQLGNNVDTIEERWMTSAEQRFYNTLPGWIKPLITYIDIYNPGQHSNSYTLRIRKAPWDKMHPNRDKFTLEAETAHDMKHIIDEYKATGRVEGVDYNYWDEW